MIGKGQVSIGFEEHPTVAKRRVRLALRQARAASKLSQGEVAERLAWSLSKVQRIEIGAATVSVTDLRALAALYDAFSPDRLVDLTDAARIARRSRWSIAPEYQKYLTPAMIDLMGYEAQATVTKAYQPVLVPGVLQTPEMADYILNYWQGVVIGEEQRRIRHEVRMLRRRQIVERDGAADYRLVLDESVLARDVGGPRLWAAQMDELEKLLGLNAVHIRLLPLAKGGLMGMLGPFAIIGMEENDAVIYRETWDKDEIVDDASVVSDHQRYFESMWAEALAEDASARLIKAKAANLRADLDRYDT